MFIFWSENLFYPKEATLMAKDLICGATIDEERAEGTYYFQGYTYHFCSPACRDKFAEATLGGMNP